MDIKIRLINNHRANTLDMKEIADIESLILLYSKNTLNVTIDPIDTDFQDIPFVFIGNTPPDPENPKGVAVTAIDLNWYRQNPALLAQGYDMCMLWIDSPDWKGSVNGLTYVDISLLPALIECQTQDLTETLNLQTTGHYGIALLAFHEIRHAMCAIAKVTDDTHQWLAQGKIFDSYSPENFNYDAFWENLLQLRSTQPEAMPIVYDTPANFSIETFHSFSPFVQAAMVFNAEHDGKNVIINGNLVIQDPNFTYTVTE